MFDELVNSIDTTPVQTPLGMAYPTPAVRRLIDAIQNIQKRMTDKQRQINGINFGTPKEFREERLAKLQSEMAELNAELLHTQEMLGKNPLLPEHFKHPARFITRCCKEYPIESVDQDDETAKVYRCPTCGKMPAEVYKRIEEETEKDEAAKKHWSDKMGGDDGLAPGDKPLLLYDR